MYYIFQAIGSREEITVFISTDLPQEKAEKQMEKFAYFNIGLCEVKFLGVASSLNIEELREEKSYHDKEYDGTEFEYPLYW